MQITLLCLSLFLQAPATPELEPPQPLLVLKMPDPVATVGEFLHGALHETVVQSKLWGMARKLPEFSAVEVGWNFFLKPAGGDANLFVASFAGDGLYLFVVAGPELENGEKGKGEWALVGLGHDGELAQDCFVPPLQLKGMARSAFHGESWEVQVDDKITFMRQENRFLIGSNATLLHQLVGADLAQLAAHEDIVQVDGNLPPDISGWINGDALRKDGFTDKPNNAGASYLFGELHEALRTAPWLAVELDIQDQSLALQFTTPASESFRDSHAPYFPGVREIPMPALEQGILYGVFSRDLAHWWAGRAEYLTARGLAETIEGDGVLKLLFARDPAADVFLHLEPEIRWLVAPLQSSDADRLSVEYPAAAMGLQFKENAPDDLEQAFSNAFLSAITFANFDGGNMGQPTLEMNIRLHESGKIYTAAYPKWTTEDKKPGRYNLSPSMLVMPNGGLWISSSLGLLEEIASAPVQMVSAGGMWLDFEMKELAAILHRDRAHVVANRMLEEGGDLEAAERFTEFVFAAIDLMQSGGVRSFLDGEKMHLELQLNLSR
ncbi:MAG: hypothetical protein COA70_04645 [Planctomycetota bacterium]|nr:MAG: hypothetical protein COA70_04645 [Planctomycetota bacterium]